MGKGTYTMASGWSSARITNVQTLHGEGMYLTYSSEFLCVLVSYVNRKPATLLCIEQYTYFLL